MSAIQAIIVTIGDELLIGQTIDTNSAWIAQQLNAIGIDVVRRVAVGDTDAAIRQALDEELPKVDIVLLTGGLGPTSDDITKPLLCDYFGGRLIVNEAVLAHVKDMFIKRNRPLLEANLKQAEVPDNCTVLENTLGTAPGMLFKKNGKLIIAMPGVPFEMMSIMQHEVLPLLEKQYHGDAIIHQTIVTVGEGESFIAEKLVAVEAALPQHIRLAYLPSPGIVKLRLTGKAADGVQLRQEIAGHHAAILSQLHDIVLASEDMSIEAIVGKALLDKKATLSLAESCTGGYISHRITQVAGASAYLIGGIISYHNDIKKDYLEVSEHTLLTQGAVSEATVRDMATSIRKQFKTTYSLAVSGILGPGGATEEKPVGTVWMAAASPDKVITKHFRFHHDRERNKELAANMGLLLLWRLIEGRL